LIDFSNKKLQTTGPYYPALDGLRGLAIILIILYHIFNFGNIFEWAWVGVDLFFVLSGFLITGILLRGALSEHFPRDFYIRRVLRIFPIYYLSLIVFLFILPRLINYPFHIHFLLQNQLWFWLYVQNWLFILKNPGNSILLNHFWSLALEEQFYLLWPWIILLAKIPQKLITLLLYIMIVLLLSRIVILMIQINTLSYINLFKFTRIDSLCAGSMLAAFKFKANPTLETKDKVLFCFLGFTVLAALPAIKIIFNWHLPYLACCIYPVIALIWAICVNFSLNNQTVLYQIFDTQVIKFFGKISYGLYIFHWPVYKLFSANSSRWLPIHFHSTMITSLFISSLSTVTAIILAVFSYYFIEIHFLKLKRKFV
jgi:peptidoglycan/LPS O-acetylase OafA/YrhL